MNAGVHHVRVITGNHTRITTVTTEDRDMLLNKLRVKVKSLAAEAAVIRHEEWRCRRGWHWLEAHQFGSDAMLHRSMYHELRHHRVVDLRVEARHAQLAYAYLRGRAYLVTEPGCRRPPNLGLVAKVVSRFGGGNFEMVYAAVKVWHHPPAEVAAARVA